MAREIWVYVEENQKEIELVSYELLGEGQKIAKKSGDQLCAIYIGYKISEKNLNMIMRYGVERIYLADCPEVSGYNTEIYTEIIYNLAVTQKPKLFLIGGSPNSYDFAPRLATKLGVGMVGDCTDIKASTEGELLMIKPVYGEEVQVTYVSNNEPVIAVFRPDVIGLDEPGEVQQIPIQHINININNLKVRVKEIAYLPGDPSSVDLEEAEIIIAGGRGMAEGEHWELIQRLADTLGGSVGGSRMALDFGLIERNRLVGQTGKTVRPKLYMAIGISGASQHLGGMKDSEKVIAINIDRQAPIIKSADLAIEADAHKLLPLLIEELKEY